MRLLTLLLLVVALLPACGSDDGSDAPVVTATTPTPPVLAPPPAAAAYEVIEVTESGTIKGTVRYTGDRRDEPVPVDKDTAVCDPDGDGLMPASSLLVGEGGALQGAVVQLRDIHKGAAYEPAEALIDNKDCVFVPRLTLAATGQMLTATNSDPILHNTHLFQHDGNRNLVNIALPTAGKTARKPLRKRGLIDVKCDAHKWMAAYIWVTDHPYIAITTADGTFALEQVPAGIYTATVWHEELGEQEAQVEVMAPAGTTTLDFTYE
jgi:plastocyanin